MDTLLKRLLLLLLPVFGSIFIRLLLPALDRIFGDGSGLSERSAQLLFAVDALMLVLFIALLFVAVLKVSFKVFAVNFFLVVIILYGVEYYLYKKDPFLKLPFDSGYYDANLIKYGNFLRLDFNPYEPYRTWGHVTRANNYGFREREAGEKKDSVYRIMVLGDSFTWGAGLGEKQRYSNMLDSLLRSEHLSVEVLNFGYSGSPTIEERDLLVKIGKMVKPDLIIVGFCLNDPQPLSEDFSIEKEKFNQRYSKLFSAFQRRMSFVRLQYTGDMMVKFFYKIARLFNAFPSDTEALGRAYEKNSREWKSFEQSLSDIKQMSDSLGCDKPVMGIFNQMSSISHELVTTRLNAREKEDVKLRLQWLAQVKAAAEQAGFTAIDYGPAINSALQSGLLSADSLMVTPLDGHPSPQLNAIYAQEMFKIIEPMLRKKSE